MTAEWRPAIDPQTLRERAALVWQIREFFHNRQVIEVHTPILGSHTVSDVHVESIRANGGFLQTSPEYFMKRLLAAGAPSCYQIGPVFRKGEIGKRHNPEFAMLEWYRLGYDAEQLRCETSELVNLVLGECSYQTISFQSLMRERFHVDVFHESNDSLSDIATEHGYQGGFGEQEILDFLYSEAIRQCDAERVFVVNFPQESAALSRTVSVDGLEVADRFELIVTGVEIANGYYELLDGGELARRIEMDNRKRVELARPPIEPDPRLLAAMKHGLPSCAGVAVGLDRLIALALGRDNIREVMTFPDGLA
ncbi:MAG: EF-P lysine aminoacylase EpmA [Gammaproteobacteria bacterium]|nr:EF-P lysine aminoacylase EpmA [Gammaproteobacteria bacterium]